MTSTKRHIASATKDGKAMKAMTGTWGPSPMFEFYSLSDAGWIRITHAGQENVYFEWRDDAGDIHLGYCKCL